MYIFLRSQLRCFYGRPLRCCVDYIHVCLISGLVFDLTGSFDYSYIFSGMNTQKIFFFCILTDSMRKLHSILIRKNMFHAFLVGLFVLSAAVCSLLASAWRKPKNKTVTTRRDPEILAADTSAVVFYDEEVFSPIP